MSDDVPVRGRFLDLDVEIATDDPALAAHLHDLYVDAQPPIGACVRFGLTRDDDVTVLTIGDDVEERSVDAGWCLAMLHWHLNQRIVERSAHRLLVHAGAVERDGRVALILGDSGAGKTTATLWLARNGWGYVADDTVAIAGDGTVTGAARPVSIRPGTPELLGLDTADLEPPAPYRGGAEWFGAPSGLGARVVESGVLSAVVVLGEPGGSPPPSRAGVVAAISRSVFDLGRDTEARLATIERLARSLPVLHRPGRDLSAVDRWLTDTIG